MAHLFAPRDTRDMSDMTAPTPPGEAGSGPRRLVRTSDKKIAGVAAGIAHYLGLDPTIVRIAFLVLAFAGGVGIILYLACWIAMPKGEISPVDGAPRAVDPWFLAALGALVLGLAMLFGWDSAGPGFEVTVGIALVVGGVWLLLRDRGGQGRAGGDGTTATPPAAPPPGAPSGAPTPSTDLVPHAAGPPAPPGGPAAARPTFAATATVAQPVPDDPRRGAVTAGVLSLLAIGVAFAIAGALSGWFDVSTSVAVAGALVVIGAGLVVASVVGRAPWLLAFGFLLTAVLLAAAAIEPLVEDGVGERLVQPASAAELAPRYRFGIGEHTVDLRDVSLAAGTTRIEAALGIGQLVVVVPDDTTTVVDAEVGAGSIVLPSGREVGQGGVDGIRETATVVVPGTAGGRLVVDANLGVGELVVRRATDREVIAP